MFETTMQNQQSCKEHLPQEQLVTQEVYLLAKKQPISKLYKRNKQEIQLSLPTSKQILIEKDTPVFISKEQAFEHLRFLSNDRCVVKAYVFDIAIESKNQRLCIRRGYLNHSMVHGFYLSYNPEIYIKNPSFDPRHQNY